MGRLGSDFSLDGLCAECFRGILQIDEVRYNTVGVNGDSIRSIYTERKQIDMYSLRDVRITLIQPAPGT